MSVFNLYPTINPTLSFDFVNARALDPSITFTRNTSATYFDETGILRVAGANTPRLDYDPATLAARGFLIEESRTNLLTYSEAFNTTPDWTPTRTTVSANAAVSPAGSATADALVIDTTAATNHNIEQTESITSGTTYTLSVFAKANQITQINLRFNAQFPSGNTFFDLSAGTLQNNGTVVASSITPVGNGWYRCTFTQTASATGTAAAQIFLAAGNAIAIATANGTDNVLIWGAQLEVGAFATSYIPTTTTALTRTADVASVNTLSPWFNATESTLYTELNTSVPTTVSVSAVTAGYDDGTASNRFSNFYSSNTSALAANVVPGGVSIAAATGLTLSNIQKQATRFKFANYASSANGAAAVVDTTAATVPTVNTLRIGIRPGGSQANMWLRRVTVYPRGLSNAQLQALTA